MTTINGKFKCGRCCKYFDGVNIAINKIWHLRNSYTCISCEKEYDELCCRCGTHPKKTDCRQAIKDKEAGTLTHTLLIQDQSNKKL